MAVPFSAGGWETGLSLFFLICYAPTLDCDRTPSKAHFSAFPVENGRRGGELDGRLST